MAGNDVADLDVGKDLLDDGVRARPPAGPLAPRLALHSYQSFCSFAVLRFLVFVRFKRRKMQTTVTPAFSHHVRLSH